MIISVNAANTIEEGIGTSTVLPALLIPIFGFGQYEKSNPKVLVTPAIQPAAYAFNLKDVRLLNSPFRHAMDLDSGYFAGLRRTGCCTAFSRTQGSHRRRRCMEDGKAKAFRVTRLGTTCRLVR